MFNSVRSPTPTNSSSRARSSESQCIEWYHQGQSRIVEIAGARIEVRFTGRKGRRARIAIIAPTGATFRTEE